MNTFKRSTQFAKESTVALALWVSILDLLHVASRRIRKGSKSCGKVCDQKLCL